MNVPLIRRQQQNTHCSSHKDGALAAPEHTERLFSLPLRAITVNARHGVVQVIQIVFQSVRPFFSLYENQRQRL